MKERGGAGFVRPPVTSQTTKSVEMEEAGGAIVEKNNFARKLGSTDKKTREKGLSLLVLWLSCQQVSRPFFPHWFP